MAEPDNSLEHMLALDELAPRLSFPDRDLDAAGLAAMMASAEGALKDSAADLVVLEASNLARTLGGWLGVLSCGRNVLLANPELPAVALSAVIPAEAKPLFVGDGRWLDALGDMRTARGESMSWPELIATKTTSGSMRWRWLMTGSTALLTSGTTGGSRAVEWPWTAIRRAAESMAMVGRYGPGDTLLTGLPLFHANALLVVLLPGLLRGSRVYVGEKFSATSFSQVARDVGANKTSLLGSMATLMLDRDQPPFARLERMILAPALEHVARELHLRYGCSVAEIYGQTDVGICLWNDDVLGDRAGTGRPLPGWSADLAGVDGDGEGELLVRPDRPGTAASGYLGDDALTLATRRDFWFHTGDLFARKDDFYTFRGRLKDVLRTRGENVSCAEVEAVLTMSARVRDAAVIGRPNAVGEDDVIAVLEATGGVAELVEDLRPLVLARLPRYARPVAIAVVSSLPRTPTHKVSKPLIDLSALSLEEVVWDPPNRGQENGRP